MYFGDMVSLQGVAAAAAGGDLVLETFANKLLPVARCNAVTYVLGPSLDSQNTREREREMIPSQKWQGGVSTFFPKYS